MTGTWALLRLALRRDRLLLPAWLLGLALMAMSSVVATKDLYTDERSLVSAAETINATASLVALYGRIYDVTSIGAISLIKLTAFGAALVAVLFVFVAVRHTRGDEESERLELLAAGSIGRLAPLAAALVVGGGASVALGLLTGLGLVAAGLPVAGAVAFGAGWACAGLVYTTAAAVAAQVMPTARGAIGLGVALVGLGYALRAIGDLGEGDPGPLSWLSPIGWSQQIRPFAGDRWWVIAIPLVATAALAGLALALRARRDLGAGLIPERTGPAVGRLGSVEGLAWRLQRAMLLAWAVGAALMGLVMGSVAHTISGLLDSPQMAVVFEALGGRQGLTDMFLAAEVGLIGALVSAYAIAAALRLRSEETSGHVELLLSTATSRVRWAASHIMVALVGTAAIILLTGAATGLGHGLAIGDVGGQVPRMVGAAAAQVPAAWVMGAIVVLLFGVLPRVVLAAWGLLVAFLAVGEFGSLWQLPPWVLDLSPFAHSPRLPGSVDAAQAVVPMVSLVGVSAALIAMGLAAWRRRDLHP